MIMTPKIVLLILSSSAFITTSMAAETSTGSRLVHRKHLLQEACKEDISVAQIQDDTGGIPKYSVEIVNDCVSGRATSNIHFHCGWFSSTNLINPAVFKRLAYDDCLVNDGKPLEKGAILSFYYSNTFMYPLSFKSASFC